MKHWPPLVFVALCACKSGPPTDDPDARGDEPTGDAPTDEVTPPPVYGLDQRPLNETCRAFPRPTPQTGVEVEPAFPNLTFIQPVGMVHQQLTPGDESSWRF